MNPYLNGNGIEPRHMAGSLLLALVVVCTLTTGSGCKDQQVNRSMTMQQELRNANAECDVRVSLSVKDDSQAECVITVKNLTDRDLYLFNRLYKGRTKEGQPDTDRDLFYSYSDDRGRLVLTKAIIPVPSGLHVEYKIYPGCTKVTPGGSTKDQLTLVLPIELYAPYTQKHNPSPGSLPNVMFRFGYFIGHEGTAAMEIKLPSKDGEVIHFDPFDDNFQKIIDVGPFGPLPIAE